MFDFKIESKEDLKILIEVLNGVSKNETIEDHKRHIKILNTKQNVIAISMSNIRKFAKQIFKAGYEKFLELSLPNNFHDEFYEETLIQGLVIAEIKDLEIPIIKQHNVVVGCAGSIGSTFIGLLSLSAILIYLKKKKKIN